MIHLISHLHLKEKDHLSKAILKYVTIFNLILSIISLTKIIFEQFEIKEIL
jgi:hypothetical protein